MALLTSVLAPSGVEMSLLSATATPPADVIPSTTASALATSLTTTWAPSLANSSASPRPMPPPAPVTMTIRPWHDCSGMWFRSPDVVIGLVDPQMFSMSACNVARGATRWCSGSGHDAQPAIAPPVEIEVRDPRRVRGVPAVGEDLDDPRGAADVGAEVDGAGLVGQVGEGD